MAAKNNCSDAVKYLLQRPEVSLDKAREPDGLAPLHLAASEGHKEVARLLIRRGAEVNIRDNSKEAPIHFAAKHGRLAVCELLLAKGADVNDKGCGLSPLALSNNHDHEEVSLFLTETGARICDAREFDAAKGDFVLPSSTTSAATATPAQSGRTR